ncbi:MAG: class I SAM-dependent methyltransferase [Caulobacteraceae bacterium]
MEAFKRAIANTPVLGPVVRSIYSYFARPQKAAFEGSTPYWEDRYRSGRDSGAGSYNRLAQFKAEILNEFVASHGVSSVVEFGCGDGAQLALAKYRNFVGVDISRRAIELCRERFHGDATKAFYHRDDLPPDTTAELVISLDVIYHLVEDDVYEKYMRDLFSDSSKYVVIYSSDFEGEQNRPHVRHRQFTSWIDQNAPRYTLIEKVPNRYPYDERYPHKTSFSEFFVFELT